MIKFGTVKSALLMAFIGMVIIGMVQPIAAMGQSSSSEMEQDNERDSYEGQDCKDSSHNKTMMMKEGSENEKMMHCCMMHGMMGESSENKTMMHHCMMHCMMHGMMGESSENKTMMHGTMEEKAANESCCMAKMDENASMEQTENECAIFWLKQAIELHKMHLENPSMATNESQIELMNQMKQAYKLIPGESAAMGMLCPSNESMAMGEKLTKKEKMDCMMGEKSGKKEKMESMMTEGKEAKEEKMESMMMEGKEAKEEKMESMMEGKEAKKEKMESMMMGGEAANDSCCMAKMDQNTSMIQARMDCACFWLKQAVELHKMHLENPSMATNESQIKMMCQMIKAYELIVGEKMTMELTDETMNDELEGWMNETEEDRLAEWTNKTEDEKSEEWMSAAVDIESTKSMDTKASNESSAC